MLNACIYKLRRVSIILASSWIWRYFLIWIEFRVQILIVRVRVWNLKHPTFILGEYTYSISFKNNEILVEFQFELEWIYVRVIENLKLSFACYFDSRALLLQDFPLLRLVKLMLFCASNSFTFFSKSISLFNFFLSSCTELCRWEMQITRAMHSRVYSNSFVRFPSSTRCSWCSVFGIHSLTIFNRNLLLN